MPTMDVLRSDKLVQSFEFLSQFMVSQEGTSLTWGADEQAAESVHGEILVWIRLRPDTKFYVSFVRPDWQLTLGGVKYELGFYQDIPVGTEEVELTYQDYRFI